MSLQLIFMENMKCVVLALDVVWSSVGAFRDVPGERSLRHDMPWIKGTPDGFYLHCYNYGSDANVFS